MVSNLIGNEAPLAGVAGSSPVSSALSRTETFGFFCFLLLYIKNVKSWVEFV